MLCASVPTWARRGFGKRGGKGSRPRTTATLDHETRAV